MCVEGVCNEVNIMRMRRVVVCDRQLQIMDLFLCNFVLLSFYLDDKRVVYSSFLAYSCACLSVLYVAVS
jgi:hypothetical protein